MGYGAWLRVGVYVAQAPYNGMVGAANALSRVPCCLILLVVLHVITAFAGIILITAGLVMTPVSAYHVEIFDAVGFGTQQVSDAWSTLAGIINVAAYCWNNIAVMINYGMRTILAFVWKASEIIGQYAGTPTLFTWAEVRVARARARIQAARDIDIYFELLRVHAANVARGEESPELARQRLKAAMRNMRPGLHERSVLSVFEDLCKAIDAVGGFTRDILTIFVSAVIELLDLLETVFSPDEGFGLTFIEALAIFVARTILANIVIFRCFISKADAENLTFDNIPDVAEKFWRQFLPCIGPLVYNSPLPLTPPCLLDMCDMMSEPSAGFAKLICSFSQPVLDINDDTLNVKDGVFDLILKCTGLGAIIDAWNGFVTFVTVTLTSKFTGLWDDFLGLLDDIKKVFDEINRLFGRISFLEGLLRRRRRDVADDGPDEFFEFQRTFEIEQAEREARNAQFRSKYEQFMAQPHVREAEAFAAQFITRNFSRPSDISWASVPNGIKAAGSVAVDEVQRMRNMAGSEMATFAERMARTIEGGLGTHALEDGAHIAKTLRESIDIATWSMTTGPTMPKLYERLAAVNATRIAVAVRRMAAALRNESEPEFHPGEPFVPWGSTFKYLDGFARERGTSLEEQLLALEGYAKGLLAAKQEEFDALRRAKTADATYAAILARAALNAPRDMAPTFTAKYEESYAALMNDYVAPESRFIAVAVVFSPVLAATFASGFAVVSTVATCCAACTGAAIVTLVTVVSIFIVPLASIAALLLNGVISPHVGGPVMFNPIGEIVGDVSGFVTSMYTTAPTPLALDDLAITLTGTLQTTADYLGQFMLYRGLSFAFGSLPIMQPPAPPVDSNGHPATDIIGYAGDILNYNMDAHCTYGANPSYGCDLNGRCECSLDVRDSDEWRRRAGSADNPCIQNVTFITGNYPYDYPILRSFVGGVFTTNEVVTGGCVALPLLNLGWHINEDAFSVPATINCGTAFNYQVDALKWQDAKWFNDRSPWLWWVEGGFYQFVFAELWNGNVAVQSFTRRIFRTGAPGWALATVGLVPLAVLPAPLNAMIPLTVAAVNVIAAVNYPVGNYLLGAINRAAALPAVGGLFGWLRNYVAAPNASPTNIFGSLYAGETRCMVSFLPCAAFFLGIIIELLVIFSALLLSGVLWRLIVASAELALFPVNLTWLVGRASYRDYGRRRAGLLPTAGRHPRGAATEAAAAVVGAAITPSHWIKAAAKPAITLRQRRPIKPDPDAE
jgi:hypothetical protein